MKEKIKTISTNEAKLEEVIKSMQELVRIPSVRNEAEVSDSFPYGKAIRESLDFIAELADSFGMRSYIDPSGYYGYIEVGPKDAKEMIGIIGHVDVVPEGEHAQWTEAKPFSGDIVDGKIIGRGILDDKGPIVLNLYALKNLMDLNVEFTKRVRIILGTSEETTWQGINKYIENEEKPTIAFSPDAEFPVLNAEKTILQFDAEAPCNVDFEVKSLGAYNAVADKASYKGKKTQELIEELKKLKFEYKEENDEVIVLGKSAHAMAAFLGVNAICRLAIALYNIGERCEAIDFIAEKVKETTSAELFQGKIEEEISGILTFNIGRIEIMNGKQKIGADSRIPVLIESEGIIKKYKEELKKYNLEYSEKKIQNKLYVPEDSFLVSTLLNVYKDVTGDVEAKPLSSGGGTYARAFENSVAFGCVFETAGMIEKMHQPNECFEIKFIPPALEIYTRAIYELLK